MENDKTQHERRYEGVAVSPGIAKAVALVRGGGMEKPETYSIKPEDIPAERERLENALVRTRQQIVELQSDVRYAAGADNASIFDAHLLVLEDHSVLDQVFRKVETELINIEAAFYHVFAHYMDSLRQIKDPYLRERAIDIQDVTHRVLRNLKPRGGSDSDGDHPVGEIPHVVLSQDLTPSDTAGMDRTVVRGFATELGSTTSHAAIMARSLNIPAVVGLHGITSMVRTGDHVMIDGYNGLLIINPSPETLAEYEKIESQKGELRQSLEELVDLPAETQDGYRIVLSGNIEFVHEAELVARLGGEGIGLYRTEFAYLNRADLPSEDELYEDYRQVARISDPHGVIIRTLDAGGDKLPDSTHLLSEPNPFLGWRGIRVCLERRDLFLTQLRAILRASAEGKISIMFPFISGVHELRAAKKCVEEAKESLRNEKIAFDENIDVGVMIELPSAALTADVLAQEADFFSIGTNDLIQYTIAVDRINDRVANLFAPHHPAVLRLIKASAEAAHKHGIWIGVCGEMAGDILSAPLLTGMGITELSVGASQILQIKRALRCLRQGECAALVEDLSLSNEPEEITHRCLEMAQACYPELLT